MPKKKVIFRKGKIALTSESVERAVLFTLVGGAIVLSPMGGKVVIALARYYLKKWWDEGGPYILPEKDPAQVRQSIYKLKRNDYISWKYNKRKNVITLELTSKGRRIFQESGEAKNITNITISAPKQWDGQWRFFLFDIPEKRRNFRDILRDRLKSLGFFQFQKSVWIHPFECEKELRYICEYLGITPYTIMFTAKIDKDRILRRYFLREGVLLRRHLNLLDKGMRY